MTNEVDTCRKFVAPKLQSVASSFVNMVVGDSSMRQRKTRIKQSFKLILDEKWALIEAAVQRRSIVRGEAGNEGV